MSVCQTLICCSDPQSCWCCRVPSHKNTSYRIQTSLVRSVLVSVVQKARFNSMHVILVWCMVSRPAWWNHGLPWHKETSFSFGAHGLMHHAQLNIENIMFLCSNIPHVRNELWRAVQLQENKLWQDGAVPLAWRALFSYLRCVYFLRFWCSRCCQIWLFFLYLTEGRFYK